MSRQAGHAPLFSFSCRTAKNTAARKFRREWIPVGDSLFIANRADLISRPVTYGMYTRVWRVYGLQLHFGGGGAGSRYGKNIID